MKNCKHRYKIDTKKPLIFSSVCDKCWKYVWWQSVYVDWDYMYETQPYKIKKTKSKKYWFKMEIIAENETEYQMEVILDCLKSVIVALDNQYKWSNIKANLITKNTNE